MCHVSVTYQGPQSIVKVTHAVILSRHRVPYREVTSPRTTAQSKHKWSWHVNSLFSSAAAFTDITAVTNAVMYPTEVAHAEDCVAHLLQRIASLELRVQELRSNLHRMYSHHRFRSG